MTSYSKSSKQICLFVEVPFDLSSFAKILFQIWMSKFGMQLIYMHGWGLYMGFYDIISCSKRSKAPVSQLMDEEHYNTLSLQQLYFLKKKMMVKKPVHFVCVLWKQIFLSYTSW